MKAILHHKPNSIAIDRLNRIVGREISDLKVVLPSDRASLRHELQDADVLLHVLQPFDSDDMNCAPRLKLVQKIGVGIDTIDLASAKERGVAVCNMPGSNAAAVAELTLCLMLACLRNLARLHIETCAGRGWSSATDLVNDAGELGERTVGFLGYGDVARRVAAAVLALGAKPIAYSRSGIGDGHAEMCEFDDVVARADILSLHLPTTTETRNILNETRLRGLKKGAILINTARGSLIDRDCLVAALTSGDIAAAGLDVFSAEPIPNTSPLLKMPNVILTPHIAWQTDGTWRRSVEIVAENCRRLSSGLPLLHRVA